MFLEALHETLGEDAFLAALGAYYRQNPFQISGPGALRAALLQADGERVEKLWSEWVDAP